jgi:hypothetical protein
MNVLHRLFVTSSDTLRRVRQLIGRFIAPLSVSGIFEGDRLLPQQLGGQDERYMPRVEIVGMLAGGLDSVAVTGRLCHGTSERMAGGENRRRLNVS